jgi:hypothetical protein
MWGLGSIHEHSGLLLPFGKGRGVGWLGGWGFFCAQPSPSPSSSFPLLRMVSVVELAGSACGWPTLLALVVGSLFLSGFLRRFSWPGIPRGGAG